MDLSSLTAPLASSTIVALVALAIAIYFVWDRTRSTHVLAFWLWRLLNRGVELKDTKVATFLDEEQAVMAFRFATGLQVVSAEQAHTCAGFIRDQRLDTTQIHAARDYVRLRDNDFFVPKPPHPLAQLCRGAVAMLCLAITLAGIGGVALIDRPLVKFRDTGTWFFLSASSAERIPRVGNWDPTPLIASHCADPQAFKSRGFATDEVRRLCGLWKTPKEVETYARDALDTQRGSFGWLALVAAALGLLQGAALRRGDAANGLASKLAGRMDRPSDSAHATPAGPVTPA